MKFEYDPSKPKSNKRKHGIDFEEAKGLWSNSHLTVLAARSDVEKRR
ncbi:MAG: hypothetical protein GKR87_01020 [Kiritimatiellae bacterium]|nr:hypothetical protein [Kiritimatiellia bacterium]